MSSGKNYLIGFGIVGFIFVSNQFYTFDEQDEHMSNRNDLFDLHKPGPMHHSSEIAHDEELAGGRVELMRKQMEEKVKE
jgi:hypothetical protein